MTEKTVPEKKRVVVIGDALIDELREGDASANFVGGAGLNVAVGLAVLGVDVQLIAMVGDDHDGAAIRTYLGQHGVGLIATPGPLGTSRAVSERVNGEPRYSFNAAARRRRIVFGEAERVALAEASLVVVSCFPFDDQQQADALAGVVHNPHDRLIIDPNPRHGMMADSRLFRRNFEAAAADSLLVKLGDDDARMLYGESIETLRGALAAGGASAVLATAGAAGASVEDARGVVVSAPIAELDGPVVDTMGAGDATLASTVSSIVRGGVPDDDDGWARLLREAMLIAAATCRHPGALLRTPAAADGFGDATAIGLS